MGGLIFATTSVGSTSKGSERSGRLHLRWRYRRRCFNFRQWHHACRGICEGCLWRSNRQSTESNARSRWDLFYICRFRHDVCDNGLRWRRYRRWLNGGRRRRHDHWGIRQRSRRRWRDLNRCWSGYLSRHRHWGFGLRRGLERRRWLIDDRQWRCEVEDARKITSGVGLQRLRS